MTLRGPDSTGSMPRSRRAYGCPNALLWEGTEPAEAEGLKTWNALVSPLVEPDYLPSLRRLSLQI